MIDKGVSEFATPSAGTSGESPVSPAAEQLVFDQAIALVSSAIRAGIPVRLVGGLAVRFLTPEFPPRARAGQDLDLASVSTHRKALTDFLMSLGYEPDKTFNALYGHKQLFFASRSNGRTIDVLVDRLEMSHTLEFASRITRMPFTLDLADLLLSKLQIVELNEKDAQDVLYLISAYKVKEGDESGTISLDRFCAIVGTDWGWWRTVTLNLDKIRELARGVGTRVLPPMPSFDAAAQVEKLRQSADATPKSVRWKLRARMGERKRWYEVPQETKHYGVGRTGETGTSRR